MCMLQGDAWGLKPQLTKDTVPVQRTNRDNPAVRDSPLLLLLKPAERSHASCMQALSHSRYVTVACCASFRLQHKHSLAAQATQTLRPDRVSCASLGLPSTLSAVLAMWDALRPASAIWSS